MAELLDLTKLSPSQLSQLQKVLSAGVMPEAPEVDYSAVETVYVCHNPTQPHAFRQSDIDDSDKSSSLRKGTCSTCGARLGAGPVAINDNVIDYADAAAVRAGDTKVLAKYHEVSADQPAVNEGETGNSPDVEVSK